MDSKLVLQIKGIQEGVLIKLGNGSWEENRLRLFEQIDQQAEFLKGAQIAIDVGDFDLTISELGALRKDTAKRGMTLWAILSRSEITTKSAKDLSLKTRIRNDQIKDESLPIETILDKGEQAILVRRTLRSGFLLQHAGHVVVIGDINPGAEVIAGGDVIVWGRLRGLVHAGAEGDEHAIVCALDLSPTQLRIAGKIALTPKRKGKPQPEIAHLQNGQVVAATWSPKR